MPKNSIENKIINNYYYLLNKSINKLLAQEKKLSSFKTIIGIDYLLSLILTKIDSIEELENGDKLREIFASIMDNFDDEEEIEEDFVKKNSSNNEKLLKIKNAKLSELLNLFIFNLNNFDEENLLKEADYLKNISNFFAFYNLSFLAISKNKYSIFEDINYELDLAKIKEIFNFKYIHDIKQENIKKYINNSLFFNKIFFLNFTFLLILTKYLNKEENILIDFLIEFFNIKDKNIIKKLKKEISNISIDINKNKENLEIFFLSLQNAIKNILKIIDIEFFNKININSYDNKKYIEKYINLYIYILSFYIENVYKVTVLNNKIKINTKNNNVQLKLIKEILKNNDKKLLINFIDNYNLSHIYLSKLDINKVIFELETNEIDIYLKILKSIFNLNKISRNLLSFYEDININIIFLTRIYNMNLDKLVLIYNQDLVKKYIEDIKEIIEKEKNLRINIIFKNIEFTKNNKYYNKLLNNRLELLEFFDYIININNYVKNLIEQNNKIELYMKKYNIRYYIETLIITYLSQIIPLSIEDINKILKELNLELETFKSLLETVEYPENFDKVVNNIYNFIEKLYINILLLIQNEYKSSNNIFEIKEKIISEISFLIKNSLYSMDIIKNIQVNKVLSVPDILGYNVKYVNINVDKEALIENLRNYPMDARLLFYGIPGTGKTTFADYIAKKTGLKLYIYSASDIQGTKGGETERAIKHMFEKAEKDNAIILFDEIDSFLNKREINTTSWETRQTNEFLTKLERYKGIFIGTTNRIDSIDPAALRRFDFKIEFKPLTKNQLKEIINNIIKYYNIDFDEYYFNLIINLENVTMGDINVIIRQARFNPINNLREFYNRLLEELQLKNEELINPVGFKI